MPATRRSPDGVEIAPEQRRGEIIAILAAGLVRLIGGGGVAVGTSAEAGASIPRSPDASMPVEKLSESGEIGLELSGETRLSVLDG